MATWMQPTGAQGNMRVDDDGTNVDLYLLGVNELVTDVPWAYTLDGDTVGWRSFDLQADVSWQKLTTLFVPTTQTITFKLGATGNVKLGGPVDFEVDIQRGDVVGLGDGSVRVKDEGVHKTAIPWVRDQGVWKQALAWGRVAGEWGTTK